MRSAQIVAFSLFLSIASYAQNTAPLPVDQHEPVRGGIQAASTPSTRAAALDLLERAMQQNRFHMQGMPPYRMTAFFAGGDFSETWLNGSTWRWTGRMGSVGVARTAGGGQTLADDSTPVPMAIHLLRNAVFWAATERTPTKAQLRTAAVQVGGKPATCILVDRNGRSVEPAAESRTWDEEEFCVDNASGALVVLSIAPGTYTVYGHSKNLQFHERSLPDHITVYMGQSTPVDTDFSISDAGQGDAASITLKPGMIPNPVSLDGADRITLPVVNTVSGGAIQPVVVHAQISNGQVTETDLLTTVDYALGQKALDMVKHQNLGRPGSQIQLYITYKFVPAS